MLGLDRKSYQIVEGSWAGYFHLDPPISAPLGAPGRWPLWLCPQLPSSLPWWGLSSGRPFKVERDQSEHSYSSFPAGLPWVGCIHLLKTTVFSKQNSWFQEILPPSAMLNNRFWGQGALIYSTCRFPWCKYSHHSWFEITHVKPCVAGKRC